MSYNTSPGTYHIDQNVKRITFPFFQQLGRVVLCTFALPVTFAKVAFESFLSPWRLERVRNGREGTDTLVLARILQEQRQSTMTTHAVTCYADSI